MPHSFTFDAKIVMTIGLCIPTYNAEKYINELLASLSIIRHLFQRILIIDSSSTDGTVKKFLNDGYEVITIPSIEFDHGRTRQMAVKKLADCEFLVFLTQDSIPTSTNSIIRLIAGFDDSKVAIAYGRQLPRPGAGPIEAHARLFNYPPKSRIKSLDSIPELGLRTAVVSNSFAAYRRSTLIELGGFPTTSFGEDTYIGARAILAGYNIAYVAEATVYHSHNYSLLQEFQRYYTNGAFYAREKWILETFGKAEGSGKTYAFSELRLISTNAPSKVIKSILTVAIKYLGYLTGYITTSAHQSSCNNMH